MLAPYKCYFIYNTFTTHHCSSCIDAVYANKYLNELPIFAH